MVWPMWRRIGGSGASRHTPVVMSMMFLAGAASVACAGVDEPTLGPPDPEVLTDRATDRSDDDRDGWGSEALIIREQDAGFVSFWDPYAWNASAGPRLVNASTDPVTIDRVVPGDVVNLEVEGPWIIGPQRENVSLRAGEGWPPEYGHAVGETPWTIPESAMRQPKGFEVAASPDGWPEPYSGLFDGSNVATVLWKARLVPGEKEGWIDGFEVHFRDGDGDKGMVSYRLPPCITASSDVNLQCYGAERNMPRR